MAARSFEPAKRCATPQSFERLGGGSAALCKIVEHLDRGGDMSGGSHRRAVRRRAMDIIPSPKPCSYATARRCAHLEKCGRN